MLDACAEYAPPSLTVEIARLVKVAGDLGLAVSVDYHSQKPAGSHIHTYWHTVLRNARVFSATPAATWRLDGVLHPATASPDPVRPSAEKGAPI